jgi:hypothetical protein
MPNDEKLLDQESPFETVDNSTTYDKPTKAIPKPEKNIGIDTKDTMFQNIIGAGESSQLDMSQLESFLNVSQSRDQVYTLLDTMAEDSTIAAILETYAEDATEYNDKGQIVWCESADGNIAKYITFLLNTMNVDKNVYKWIYSLCKYGDVYLRLYRESELADPIFGDTSSVNDDTGNEDGRTLNEDVKIKAYGSSDKFTHYVEAVPNPAEVFELTKFGKTYGYIKANAGVSMHKNVTSNLQTSYYQYKFKKRDVEVFGATEFVHACLEDNTSRTPEEVNLFIDDSADIDSDTAKSYSYNVRRGQSLLYSVFKIWRELMLLENSILLNRITKSSIVRVVGVEVGDMAKEMVGPHLQGIKSLIEQKAAIKEGTSMTEYTNPGPIENNIYVPTRNGVGAISTQQIGGDVDVKSLADLDYFKNKFFGALRVPKQYFGETEDAAGFSGGQSLSIISSRYAKMVKRIQNTIIQALTDAVNLMLLDKGLDNYVNKFEIHMLPPTTQEEIDRRDNLSSKISIVGDIMNNLSDIESPSAKLRILKSLLSNVITDTDVIDIIQEQIDEIEKSAKVEEVETDVDEMDTETPDIGTESESGNSFADSLGGELGDMESETEETEAETETDSNELPSPADLGVDMTDNTADI